MMEHRVVVLCQCLGGRVKAEMGFGSCCCQANPLIYILSHKNIYQEIKVCVYMCVCIPSMMFGVAEQTTTIYDQSPVPEWHN